MSEREPISTEMATGTGGVGDIDVSGQRATEDKRRRWARLFALACLVGVALWGASVYKRIYPHDVSIQYSYRGVASPQRLQKVHASVFLQDQARPHAIITYFHHSALASDTRITRRQTLKLPKGRYPIYVTLYYNDNTTRKLKHILPVIDSGTYFVKLAKAR